MSQGHEFDHTLRMLLCKQCGAPIEAETAGGTMACSYCNTKMVLQPRQSMHTKLQGEGEPVNEARRMEILKEQDGKPLMPPEDLRKYMLEGGFRSEKFDEAMPEWQGNRDDLEKGAPFQVEERFYFLTMFLYQHFSNTKDLKRQRAILESALEVLKEPRYKQDMYCMLARNAARGNDLDSADYWLSLCDEDSQDLHMDTAYRFASSYMASMRGDFKKVLWILGEKMNQIPIADVSDVVTLVIRANALEKLHRLKEAKAELLKVMAANPMGGYMIGRVIEANPELAPCKKSYDAATEEMDQKKQEENLRLAKKRKASPFKILRTALFFVVGTIMLIMGATGNTPKFVDDMSTGDDPFMILGLILLMWGVTSGIIMYIFHRIGKKAQRMREVGIDGVAQIESMEQTGVKINSQPQVRMKLTVKVPGKDPYEVEVKKVVAVTDLGLVKPGASLRVKVDPDDPNNVHIG